MRTALLEHNYQHKFINSILDIDPVPEPQKDRILLYRDLVHYRFAEVLYKTFPVFSEKIGAKMDDLIAGFIRYKASSPYIWQMPGEFMEFIIGNHHFNEQYPYASDLLWYEWTEVPLFMKNYSPQEPPAFSWNKNWTLSDSAEIRELSYKVYLKEFNTRGVYPVILFYNFHDHEVHYREVTPFLFRLFQLCRSHTMEIACQQTCNEFDTAFNDVKEILEPALVEFVQKRIIQSN